MTYQAVRTRTRSHDRTLPRGNGDTAGRTKTKTRATADGETAGIAEGEEDTTTSTRRGEEEVAKTESDYEKKDDEYDKHAAAKRETGEPRRENKTTRTPERRAGQEDQTRPGQRAMDRHRSYHLYTMTGGEKAAEPQDYAIQSGNPAPLRISHRVI